MATKKTDGKPNLRVVGGKSGGDSGGPTSSNPRHFSVNALGKLLARDRATIMRWIAADCPVVQKANAEIGVDWVLDINQIVRWLEAEAAGKASKASARRADEDSGDPEEDAKELLRLATMQLTLDEKRGRVVQHVRATATIERHHGIIRQNVKALPLRIMDLMPGLPKDEYDRLYPLIVDVAYDCLHDAAKEIGLKPETGKFDGTLSSS